MEETVNDPNIHKQDGPRLIFSQFGSKLKLFKNSTKNCQNSRIEIMNASHQLFKSLYFQSISHLTVPLQGNLSMNWMCRSIKIRIESSKHTHKCPIGGAFFKKTIAISNFYSLILPPYEELWYSLIQNFSLHFLNMWSFFGRTLSIARGNRSDGWCPLLLKWAPVGWSSFFCVM